MITTSKYYGKATGGHPWEDNAHSQPLTSVLIRCGDRVDGIQASYGGTLADFHGSNTGEFKPSFELGDGEYICRIEGRYGNKLDTITFYTTFGNKYGPYGQPNGEHPFDVVCKKLLSFNGRAGDTLDAIAFVYSD